MHTTNITYIFVDSCTIFFLLFFGCCVVLLIFRDLFALRTRGRERVISYTSPNYPNKALRAVRLTDESC